MVFVIPSYLLCRADARFVGGSTRIEAAHTFYPEVNHVSARSGLSISSLDIDDGYKRACA